MDAPIVRYTNRPDGARVAYASKGEGTLLVLPPMTPWTLVPPRPVPPGTDIWQLAGGCQFMAYDHVGTGLSQREPFDFSLDALAEELHAVIEAQGEGDAVVLATLFAGPIAIRYAVEHPDRVRHLILRGTWPSSFESATRRLQLVRGAIEAGDWLGAAEIYVRLGWNVSGPEADDVTENLRSAIEPETLLAYFEAAATHDVTDLLPQLEIPVTVMRHSRSVSTLGNDPGDDGSNALVQAIPGAQLGVFDPDGRWDWSLYAPVVGDHAPASRSATGLDAAGLTTREIGVLRLVERGASNRQIADDLTIAESTVANHVRNILAKTGTSNRTEAGAWARRNGLLDD